MWPKSGGWDQKKFGSKNFSTVTPDKNSLSNNSKDPVHPQTYINEEPSVIAVYELPLILYSVQDETQSFFLVVVMTVVTSLPRVSYNMHVTGESVEKPKKKKYDNYLKYLISMRCLFIMHQDNINKISKSLNS